MNKILKEWDPLPRIERVDTQTLTTAALEGVYDMGYQRGFMEGQKFNKEKRFMLGFGLGAVLGCILMVSVYNFLSVVLS